METLFTIHAGLGLFFIGIRFIGDNLKRLTGGRFRKFVSASTDRHWLAALVGVIAGALTQSSNAVTFIAVTMVTAGMTSAAKVAPLIGWSNVGTSGLVLLAAFDLRLLVLFLLGAVGIAYYFGADQSQRYRHLAGAMLGVGLLFFGLQLIKEGARPGGQADWLTGIISVAANWDALGLLVGLVIAFVLQSSATVAIIAVTLSHLGLLSFDQTLILVFGAGLGSAASVGLVAAQLDGTARQLALFQIAVKVAGTLVVLGLHYVETFGGYKLLGAATRWFSDETAFRVALIFLATQFVGAMIGSIFEASLLRLCAFIAPVPEHEHLSRPRYLYPLALDDPDSAVELVEREQRELLQRLPALLPGDGRTTPDPRETHRIIEASTALSGEIERFLTSLIERSVTGETLERAMNLQGRNAITQALLETLGELLGDLSRRPAGTDPDDLWAAMGEVSHLILAMLINVLEHDNDMDRDMLQEITGDHTEIMEGIRRTLLRENMAARPGDRDRLFTATRIFERFVWLVRRYTALVVRPPQQTGAAVDTIGVERALGSNA